MSPAAGIWPRTVSQSASAKILRRLPNPSEDERLGYLVFVDDFHYEDEYTTYRKLSDTQIFGRPSHYDETPLRIAGNKKHEFFKSDCRFEYIDIKSESTPGMRSYRLSKGQVVKVVTDGDCAAGGKTCPLAAGTSRPDQVCVIDGMAVSIAVAIGGTSLDGRTAKIKVFHIHPDHNLNAVEAIGDFLEKMKGEGIAEFKVAMHGGAFYDPEKP